MKNRTGATILKVRCSYCGKDLGVKDGKGVAGTSDGICQDCFNAEMTKVIKRTEGTDIAENMKSYWANLIAGSEQ